jgi:hypothetical protein
MTIKFLRAVVAVDANGNFHAFSAESIIEVESVSHTHGFKSIQVEGNTIFIGEEPFAILLEPPLPVFIPWQPYLEIGDYTVRWYHNGGHYDTDQLPAKFLVGK